ncbi:MAG: hypothetical protein JKY34_08750 [Kordiimonadaceae bacterium]|nr:hypothetical protein [Kordiimonadaceae bacterium]
MKFSLDVLTKLQAVRDEYGHPMTISSGYRCPIANAKHAPPHGKGLAVDTLVHGPTAHALLTIATKHKVPGIGINQSGIYVQRFIHLDWWTDEVMRPRVWSY